MRETQVLTIALKEEGVSFEDIKNKINISNWDYSTIERIEFYDGTTLSLNEIIALQATNEDDNIIGTYYHDVLQGGKGNDTLYGSYGNDTYIFNRGDGQDIIYDDGSYSYYEGEEVYYGGEGTIANTSGDTVEFGEGITIDEIEVRVLDGDLLIGLREDGKGFEELNDVIRISGWESNYYSNAVETMKFADGTTYNIAEYFNLSYSEEPMEAPIVVDLNGNGVTSVSIEGNTVYFDYDADGLSERTGWIERGDALLVADVNHDGIINDGSELFGNHTKLSNGTNAANGHEAMLQYDSNYDGKIDSTDERFNELLLWKDTNLDGRSSADELSTLAVNGITSIDLSLNPLYIYENGNRISYETTYTQSNGSEGIVRDLWFKTSNDDTITSIAGEMAETGSFSDSFDDFTTENTLKVDAIEALVDSDISSFTLQSRYTGSGLDGASAQTVFEGVGYTGTLSNVWLKSNTLDSLYSYNGTLSDDVEELPSIDGQGNVIGLQEAMNEKSDLAQSVTEFQNLSESGNLADFEANIDAIIEGWALYDLGGESANSTPPIVLDMNGDGVTSQSLSSSSAYFDYDGDGRREHTAWSDEGDALLAVDLNGDGIITQGAELFGNYTLKADGSKAADGYDAMARYDTNGDNILDASDTEFSKLRLWKDTNLNGKNEAGELATLEENKISAINLSRTNRTTFIQTTEAGNIITNETNYIASSGNGTVRDVWFSYDGTDTIAYSNLRDSDEKKIAIVENFYGRRLNSEERNSVEVIAEVLNQYESLRYDTIAKIITDKLYGENFPNCTFLHMALNNTLGRVVNGESSATESLLAVNLLGALLKRNHANVLKDLNSSYLSNPMIVDLLLKSGISITYDNQVLVGRIGNRYFGNDNSESYDFSSLDSVRAYTGRGDDTVIGTDNIDELVGGEGNDILNGNGGNDVIEGGQGDDTLIGASMQNVYRYAWGDGNDTIIDAGSEKNAPDTLRFANLDISRVFIERIGDDMIIHVLNELGKQLTPFDKPFGTVTIENGYSTGKIEHFYFIDKRYTFDEILAIVPADTEYSFGRRDGNITIDEKGGKDTLYFDEGINKEDVIVRIVGDDLIIGLAQEGRTFETLSDKVRILNYVNAIEFFTFQNGMTLEFDSMVALAQKDTPINENEENFVPEALSEASYILQDIRLISGKVEATDADGDTLNYTVTTAATHGTLSVDSNGNWNYQADDLYIGTDSAIITVDDGNGGVATQTLAFDTKVSAPTLSVASVALDEDTSTTGTLNVTNPIGGALTYEIVEMSTNGEFALDAEGSYSYMPSANYNGNDSVSIKITNEYGLSTTTTLSFEVEAVNDTPIVTDPQIEIILQDTREQTGKVEATDADGDTLNYTVTTATTHGTLSVDANGNWNYQADDLYIGTDSAIITVDDGNGGVATQTLAFDTKVSAPTLSVASVALDEDTSTTGTLNVTNPIGGALTYEIVEMSTNGEFALDAEGSYSYMPSANYNGNDSVSIKITNEYGLSTTTTLSFEIEAVNDAPILLNNDTEAYTLKNIREVDGSIEAEDIEGDTLTYTVTTAAAHGTLSVDANGNWNYQANASFNGKDSAVITVDDGNGGSVEKTLHFQRDG
ncbi:MAG: Ig-like domain-containing protein, partial [Candidatus Cloacimonetes bacterium]|nr:Ig-like domain-containing protein [Candidatus Cloacimonadota bacterium]